MFRCRSLQPRLAQLIDRRDNEEGIMSEKVRLLLSSTHTRARLYFKRVRARSSLLSLFLLMLDTTERWVEK